MMASALWLSSTLIAPHAGLALTFRSPLAARRSPRTSRVAALCLCLAVARITSTSESDFEIFFNPPGAERGRGGVGRSNVRFWPKADIPLPRVARKRPIADIQIGARCSAWSPCDWLDEVVLLNESTDEAVPGDVSVHRSIGDALRSIEPWWVENGKGFASTATGERLVLKVAPSGEVIVARREESTEGQAIVLVWLQALAHTTLETRRRVAGSGKAWLSRAEEEAALPTSVEGLLAYIGFPWVAPRDWFVPSCLILLGLLAILLALILVKLL